MTSRYTYSAAATPLYPVEEPPYTVEVPGYAPIAGETIPRRHPKAVDGLVVHPAPGVSTTFDLVRRSAKKYADEPAVGSRKLIDTHVEKTLQHKVVDGKTVEVPKAWTYYEFSDYKYLTYSEYLEQALQVGAGLRKLGLNPHDRLHLFAATSTPWLTMFHACSSQSMAIVTAYDNLGESGVEHSLLQSKANAVFVDPHLLKIIRGPLTKAKTVRFLIYNEESNNREPGDDEEIAQFKAANPDLTVLSFGDLRALGEAHPAPPVEPSPEDMCCIMYTSGSTGPPKGVPVTHATFVAAVAGLYTVVEGAVSHEEFVLAYLPLAHIFELVLENLALFVGATLGYGSSRTLSDTSMRNCHGDMKTFRPTIMVGVPQVWETVKKGIEAKVQGNPITRSLFWAGVHLKSFLVRHNLPGASLIDRLVFSKVSENTGGRLRFIVNGASAISDPTRHFMSMVVAPMLNGYGLTETCGNGAMGNPLEWTPGSSAVGPIPAAVEVKLVSIPELNYSTDSSPPQGEILIRGGAVIKEYFENPEETAKAITPDGWFRSGDIGQFEPNGHLAIIDRVKNLVKLQGGEYIALEKLEAIYLGSATVEQIMVHGDSGSPKPIGIVVVKDNQVQKVAAGVGVGGSPDDMRKDAKVRGAVLKELQGLAKKEGLRPMETLSGVVLVDGPWDPKDGLVTATQKINRKAVRERFAKEIKACMEGK